MSSVARASEGLQVRKTGEGEREPAFGEPFEVMGVEGSEMTMTASAICKSQGTKKNESGDDGRVGGGEGEGE